jgi:hypothetical protein
MCTSRALCTFSRDLSSSRDSSATIPMNLGSFGMFQTELLFVGAKTLMNMFIGYTYELSRPSGSTNFRPSVKRSSSRK